MHSIEVSGIDFSPKTQGVRRFSQVASSIRLTPENGFEASIPCSVGGIVGSLKLLLEKSERLLKLLDLDEERGGVVQVVLNATIADLSRFQRPGDRFCFEDLSPTVLCTLAQASRQPASVVTLVLTGLSDWFEAHASGVVVKERWETAPDFEGNGNLPPP